MIYEFVGKPDVVPLDVMVKPFRPHPKTVCKISAAHLFVFNAAPETAIRKASPDLVRGTGSQIRRQFLVLFGWQPAWRYHGAGIRQL
jgi:hypothetical protein